MGGPNGLHPTGLGGLLSRIGPPVVSVRTARYGLSNGQVVSVVASSRAARDHLGGPKGGGRDFSHWERYGHKSVSEGSENGTD